MRNTTVTSKLWQNEPSFRKNLKKSHPFFENTERLLSTSPAYNPLKTFLFFALGTFHLEKNFTKFCKNLRKSTPIFTHFLRKLATF